MAQHSACQSQSKRKTLLSLIAAITVALFFASNSWAEKKAEHLGAELTPYGAEKAGNAEGTIPPWKGGLTAPPENSEAGVDHPNPFADDKVKFTITQANSAEYANKLTAGHQAMLKTYDSFKMKVYPTHRSASAPQRIYDATKKNINAKLTASGNGVTGAIHGIPFPMPENGLEVIWNHILRYRGDTASRLFSQAAPTRGGDYTLVRFQDEFNVQYSQENMTEADLNNVILQFKQKVLSPPRLAGGILLVHETLDQFKEPRKAWLYNPGQRRVRRAPNVAFDNPGTASDGMRTTDQYDMFTGSPERYDWELVGKKEVYVPYNSYDLHSKSLKYKDILTPLHINPEYLRYELHRVWVVEAKLKPGMRHIYKRRTFYIDE
ncbi:MAG: DUF1329 domain-containing protein, partial [Gammaproteobacteria bacterium]|nr:DUF1329 domain-containing protein [Gammaproteobacteria bacterium]